MLEDLLYILYSLYLSTLPIDTVYSSFDGSFDDDNLPDYVHSGLTHADANVLLKSVGITGIFANFMLPCVAMFSLRL